MAKDNNLWLASLSKTELVAYRANLNARIRERYANDPLKREAARLDSFLRYRAKRAQALTHLGARCSNPHCGWTNADGSIGCTDARCLQIDHVKGDGAKKRHGGEGNGVVSYRKVLKTVPGEEYQLLCANCNWIKREVNGELPRARKLGTDYVFVDKRKSRIKDAQGRFASAVAGGS